MGDGPSFISELTGNLKEIEKEERRISAAEQEAARQRQSEAANKGTLMHRISMGNQKAWKKAQQKQPANSGSDAGSSPKPAGGGCCGGGAADVVEPSEGSPDTAEKSPTKQNV